MKLRTLKLRVGGINDVTLVLVYDEDMLFSNVPVELRKRFIETFQDDEADVTSALAQMLTMVHDISRLLPGGILTPVMMTIWRQKLIEAIDAMQGVLYRVDKGENPWTIFDEFLPLPTNPEEDQKSDQNLEQGPFKDFIEGLDLTDDA